MSAPDPIRIYDDLLPESFCARVRKAIDARTSSKMFDEEWRRCYSVTFLDLLPNAWEELRGYLRTIMERYRSDLNIPTLSFIGRVETSIVHRYDADDPSGPHRFHTHSDAWSMDSASRQISVIAYLNDVEKGGETAFPHQEILVQPKRGRILVFPSSFLFEHEGRSPISGSKYAMVTWLHFDGTGHAYLVLPLYD